MNNEPNVSPSKNKWGGKSEGEKKNKNLTASSLR